ncbi:hypothetical protein AVEN_86496-1, partial [Araneus ventricosus]
GTRKKKRPWELVEGEEDENSLSEAKEIGRELEDYNLFNTEYFFITRSLLEYHIPGEVTA